MTSSNGDVSATRPVLFGETGPARPTSRPRGGGKGRVVIRDNDQRIQRLTSQFEAVQSEFESQVQLSTSLQASDPQLVLVMEAVDEQVDLKAVARKLGMEVLVEVEDQIDPDDEYGLVSERPRNPLIGTCIHAICLNQAVFNKVLGIWRRWRNTQEVPYGFSPLRDLFEHLKDVRPWGPEDRLKMVDWDEYFAGRIPGQTHDVEIELWYRSKAEDRTKAQVQVASLVVEAGGAVASTAVIHDVGYHGLKCTVSDALLRDLANGRFDDVKLVKSAEVMYFRISAQSLPIYGESVEPLHGQEAPLPTEPPIVCVLDGVPVSNHPLLSGRVMVHDPDGLEEWSTVAQRKHGTHMVSAVIWGDRGASEIPTNRQVLARPILAPSPDTLDGIEELPAGQLAPELTWRVFREIFETQDGRPAVAPGIMIMNLSVADPTTPFDNLMSSWARMIDWLSYRYGVLVIVSAGNHASLNLSPMNTDDLISLTGGDRRNAVIAAQYRDQIGRRLLSPAESINAITVGAVHSDASDVELGAYAVDPADGLDSISPITAFGGGYRRSIKPEVAAPGGRVTFRRPITPGESLFFSEASRRGPGVRVAAPDGGLETFSVGTSPAAALVTRQAARIHDLVEGITAGRVLTRRQWVSAIKALLVHGVEPLPGLAVDPFAIEQVMGNGVIRRDLSQGCAKNEAVVLFVGSISASAELDLIFPLTDGLNSRGVKRIDATLAWMSPVNWRHRQYRKAALAFVKPGGEIPNLPASLGVNSGAATRGAATVQRQRWEVQNAFASGKGSEMVVRVKCVEQAGGLDGERVDFAAVLSLWIAPEVGVDVYAQVREQVQTRVEVRP